MAITYVTSHAFDETWDSSGTPVTHSAVDLGSVTDGLALLIYTWRDTAACTIAGVTVGGNAATSLGAIAGSGTVGQIFRRVLSSTGGTQDIVTDPVATFGTGEDTVSLIVLVYSGVDQTTPIDGYTTATGSDTTLELTVTSATGDRAFFAGSIRSFGSDMTVTVSAVDKRRIWNGANGEMSNAAGDDDGAASVAFLGTDNGSAGTWLAFGGNMNVAAGGGGATLQPIATLHRKRRVA